jgi:hypothetical protein
VNSGRDACGQEARNKGRVCREWEHVLKDQKGIKGEDEGGKKKYRGSRLRSHRQGGSSGPAMVIAGVGPAQTLRKRSFSGRADWR